MKRKRNSPPAVFTVRVPFLISKEQYRKLMEMSNAAKVSMGAVLRAMLDAA